MPKRPCLSCFSKGGGTLKSTEPVKAMWTVRNKPQEAGDNLTHGAWPGEVDTAGPTFENESRSSFVVDDLFVLPPQDARTAKSPVLMTFHQPSCCGSCVWAPFLFEAASFLRPLGNGNSGEPAKALRRKQWMPVSLARLCGRP